MVGSDWDGVCVCFGVHTITKNYIYTFTIYGICIYYTHIEIAISMLRR